MPVGLHILLKHVPEYQELLGIPVGTTSEEPLEHLHRITRAVLRRHSLTSTLDAAPASLLKFMLICSSPSVAAKYPGFEKIKRSEIPDDLAHLLLK